MEVREMLRDIHDFCHAALEGLQEPKEALGDIFDILLIPKGRDWISVKERLPEPHQDVAFVVESTDKNYNRRVMGGRFQGTDNGYAGFSVPGIEFAGSHWMPLPEPPTK